jgi:hypothetical protein
MGIAARLAIIAQEILNMKKEPSFFSISKNLFCLSKNVVVEVVLAVMVLGNKNPLRY